MARQGFGVMETLVVAGVLVVVGVAAAPTLTAFGQATRLRAGAHELAALLNRGRQLAITEGTPICVEVAGTAVRFWPVACGTGAAWAGTGTDGAGWVRLATGVRATAPVSVVFSPLGGASPGATLTVTHPPAGDARSVVVAVSGRVRVR